MSFSQFCTILLILYSSYYTILILTDLVRTKPLASGDDSIISYDFEMEPPQKVTLDMVDHKPFESEGGAGQAIQNKGEERMKEMDEVMPEEEPKISGDLGLEPLDTDDIKVEEERLKKIYKP